MLEKTEEAIKNGQSRDTGNIGYTRHKTKTIQRHWQHWVHKKKNKTKTQHRDTGNTGYTRRKTKLKHNTETPATLGTQEEKQN